MYNGHGRVATSLVTAIALTGTAYGHGVLVADDAADSGALPMTTTTSTSAQRGTSRRPARTSASSAS
ncbi:hypothetical protein [Streptomyces sp. NPDC002845]